MNNPSANRSVLVALSGGVDSSVAALLLQEKGYEVQGVTLRTWGAGGGEKEESHIVEARRAADALGIPHHTLDVREKFAEVVIRYFVSEYNSGRTPNPCVFCNPLIKWGELWKLKEKLGLANLATGHYARIVKTSDGWGIFRALDGKKDQSYVLHRLERDRLAHTLFPLGEFTKDQVRSRARQRGLPTAERPESQEICFIPENDYTQFLKKQGVPDNPGDIIDQRGKIVGRHLGIIHYTLGQRKGLGGGFPEPMFVHRIDSENNTVHIGPRDLSEFHFVQVGNVNWLISPSLDQPFTALVKIRYADKGREAKITPRTDFLLDIEFPEGAEAPTPGQAAVMYLDERLIAGGIIEKVH